MDKNRVCVRKASFLFQSVFFKVIEFLRIEVGVKVLHPAHSGIMSFAYFNRQNHSAELSPCRKEGP